LPPAAPAQAGSHRAQIANHSAFSPARCRPATPSPLVLPWSSKVTLPAGPPEGGAIADREPVYQQICCSCPATGTSQRLVLDSATAAARLHLVLLYGTFLQRGTTRPGAHRPGPQCGRGLRSARAVEPGAERYQPAFNRPSSAKALGDLSRGGHRAGVQRNSAAAAGALSADTDAAPKMAAFAPTARPPTTTACWPASSLCRRLGPDGKLGLCLPATLIREEVWPVWARR
jgi:hypothetical protein